MRVFVQLVAAALVVSASLPVKQVAAQSSPVPPISETVCMVRSTSAGETGPNPTLRVVLTQTDVAAMSASGFVVTPCAGAFASRAEMIAWRDEICQIASTANEAVQESLERRLGAKPAVFCGMAQRALGEWDRRGGAQ